MHGIETFEADGDRIRTDFVIQEEEHRRGDSRLGVVHRAQQRRVSLVESQQTVSAAVGRRRAPRCGADADKVKALIQGFAVAFASELCVLERSFLPFCLHLYRGEMLALRMGAMTA